VLTTWLTERFGIAVPVVCAPMSGAAGGRLAAAVSDAGGLGMVGFDDFPIELVRPEAALAGAGGRPYGIGLQAWRLPAGGSEAAGAVEAVAELRPALVSLSYGPYEPHVGTFHAVGVPVATQVGTVEEARHAVDAGIDVVVARGSEGGGHGRGEVATLPLLQAVLDAVDVPVLAAGGIGTGRGLAAVLAAGAAGAWVGTAFVTCAESAWSPARKRAVLSAGLTDTVYSRVFDVAIGAGWPSQFGGRAVRNGFAREWHGREDELADRPDVRAAYAAAFDADDFAVAAAWAGQGAGLVDHDRTAAEVVAELATAEELLRRWAPA
jgi:nitronate monooxygenase